MKWAWHKHALETKIRIPHHPGLQIPDYPANTYDNLARFNMKTQAQNATRGK